jgi:ATP-dependent DNA ligase
MPLPRIQPIAPVRAKAPFGDPEWLFDLKYDGFRALAYLERGRCRLISRNGNLMSRFARLSNRIGDAARAGDERMVAMVMAMAQVVDGVDWRR